MTIGVLKTLGTFLIFLLVQVLVLNHVHLFDSATPLLYIYMVLLFPRNYPKWALLVWAFAMGLGVDMFSNTPGVAAASLTLVALLRPYLLELFIQRESADDLVPSMKVLGFSRYLFFAFLIMNEHFFAIDFVGMAMILAAVVLISVKDLLKERRKKEQGIID